MTDPFWQVFGKGGVVTCEEIMFDVCESTVVEISSHDCLPVLGNVSSPFWCALDP